MAAPMTASLGKRAISAGAFATLLLVALMMGANHIAARVAFNNGVDVATAVVFRSTVTALVVGGLVIFQQVPRLTTARHKSFLLLIGLLIGAQSLCLYSSVARLPVALALLAFNTYPLWTALWDRVLYKRRPERATLQAMPIILVGLALALDVLGAASGLGAAGQWARIGGGVAFALAAAAIFGMALVLTQHETATLDGRLRTACTMLLAGLVAFGVTQIQGGLHLPTANAGWWGLGTLTFLYGTAFTILFTVLPKLGVAGNSAIMNVEPVFALVLAWLILGQTIAPIQVAGALLVVGAVMVLGLRKK
jgi:drug/metabolite transporter (DMT)-like permease